MSLTGPSVEALSGRADSLVIFLHGYGSDGEDLIGLVPVLQEAMPNTAFIAPNGPAHCEMGGPGYQWFSIGQRALDDLAEGVLQVAPLIVLSMSSSPVSASMKAVWR